MPSNWCVPDELFDTVLSHFEVLVIRVEDTLDDCKLGDDDDDDDDDDECIDATWGSSVPEVWGRPRAGSVETIAGVVVVAVVVVVVSRVDWRAVRKFKK
jgi:hypothetical protein